MRFLQFLFITLLLSPKILPQWEIVIPKPVTDKFTAIYMFDELNGIITGRDFTETKGVIFRTADGFNTYQRIETPYTITKMNFFGNEKGYAISLDEKSFIKTTNGGNSWNKLSTPPGDIYEFIFCNADTGVIRAGAGLYSTLNGGLTWSNIVLPETGINSFYFLDANNGFVCILKKKYKTTDGGLNWTVLAQNNYRQYYKIIFKDFQNGFYVDDSGYLYKTTNGGVNWTYQQTSANGCKKIFYKNSTIWFQNGNYSSWILYSTNNGATWKKSAVENKIHSFIMADVHYVNDLVFYSAGGIGSIGKTTNGGETWIDLGSTAVISSKIDFTKDNFAFASLTYRSSDGGLNWFHRQIYYDEGSINYYLFLNKNTAFVYGYPALYKTTDGGNSFRMSFYPTEMGGVYYLQFLDDSTGYFIEMYVDGQQLNWYYLQKTNNQGYGWMSRPIPYFNGFGPKFLKVINKDLIFSHSWNAGFRSTDEGITWHENDFGNAIYYYFYNGSSGYALNSNGTLLKTYDRGTSFITIASLPINTTLTAMVFKDSLNGWIGSNKGVYYSSDGGYNWELDFSVKGVSDVKIHDNKVYAVIQNEVIIMKNLDAVPVELISFTGAIKENQIELKWSTASEQNNKGFYVERKKEQTKFDDIKFISGKGNSTERQDYIFNESVEPGIYKYRLKQVDYDGSFKYSNEITISYDRPEYFLLEQNYPNPFNPSTLIEYNISKKSFVTLNIYNVLGREVSRLVNEEKSPGNYSVPFNASNLPSGVYIYRIKAGNFVSAKQMLLIK